MPHDTEVATRVTPEEPEVTFNTDERLIIVPPKLVQLRTEDDFNKSDVPCLGIEVFCCFKRKPEIGDTFYLGFDETQATGGLNNPNGSLTLKPDAVHGRNAYWLRCRIEQRRPEQGIYTQSPRILNVAAYSLGTTTTAAHAVSVSAEVLGTSNGEPGQVFHTQHAPVLAMRDGETVEVEELRDRERVFISWQPVDDFAHSDRHERHFTLDTSTGGVCFGPAVRQADGSVRQYGRVPEADSLICISQHRHGASIAGNVPIGKIQVLKTTIHYVADVTNLKRADGGRDPESLDELKQRARREIHAQ